MSSAAFIAGDWGTSNLRLSLCNAEGGVLDSLSGPGIASLSTELKALQASAWSTRFTALCAHWAAEHGSLPTLLCGMIGSNIGWANVPYVTCPTTLDGLAMQLQQVDTQVSIVPGLSCTNRNAAPDVMRGEETQIIGALRLHPALSNGRQLLCLPGTHTKWALIDNGQVCEFVTAIAGELFALIKQHSVLVRATQQNDLDTDTFDRAVQQLKCHGSASLLQLIFECRSRQLVGDIETAHAATYLSGLLIAADVLGALRLYAASSLPITIIGVPQLTDLYARVCAACGVSSLQLNGEHASLAGLTSLYLQRYGHTS